MHNVDNNKEVGCTTLFFNHILSLLQRVANRISKLMPSIFTRNTTHSSGASSTSLVSRSLVHNKPTSQHSKPTTVSTLLHSPTKEKTNEKTAKKQVVPAIPTREITEEDAEKVRSFGNFLRIGGSLSLSDMTFLAETVKHPNIDLKRLAFLEAQLEMNMGLPQKDLNEYMDLSSSVKKLAREGAFFSIPLSDKARSPQRQRIQENTEKKSSTQNPPKAMVTGKAKPNSNSFNFERDVDTSIYKSTLMQTYFDEIDETELPELFRKDVIDHIVSTQAINPDVLIRDYGFKDEDAIGKFLHTPEIVEELRAKARVPEKRLPDDLLVELESIYTLNLNNKQLSPDPLTEAELNLYPIFEFIKNISNENFEIIEKYLENNIYIHGYLRGNSLRTFREDLKQMDLDGFTEKYAGCFSGMFENVIQPIQDAEVFFRYVDMHTPKGS